MSPTSGRRRSSSTTRMPPSRRSPSRSGGSATRYPARPLGVLRDVERPVYDELMAAQLEEARRAGGEGDLEALLHAGDTWQIQ